MDLENLCPHCFVELNDRNSQQVCPKCGKPLQQFEQVSHQLPNQTILAGKYLIGDVLGEGGFGITYVAYDLNLEMRVAIKEFYPNGYATRESTTTTMVTLYKGKDEEAVKKWRDSFIKEARSLAKCARLSGVVGVKDYFLENESAYIVLEYLDGVTLKEHVKNHQGKLLIEPFLQAMEPIFIALNEVHKQGIIHRDISPDNIMLMPDGRMKLLDFGAAREFADADGKSLSVMLKPGYAPEEQYRSKGKQGPWSDVYALAGTIYRCITGVTPPEAMERLRKDELVPPSRLGIAIAPQEEAALMKALAVFAESRFQTVDEFYQAMYHNAPVQANVNQPGLPPAQAVQSQGQNMQPQVQPFVQPSQPQYQPKKKSLAKPIIAAAVIVLAFASILLWKQNTELKQETENGVEQNAASGDEAEDVVAQGNEADQTGAGEADSEEIEQDEEKSEDTESEDTESESTESEDVETDPIFLQFGIKRDTEEDYGNVLKPGKYKKYTTDIIDTYTDTDGDVHSYQFGFSYPKNLFNDIVFDEEPTVRNLGINEQDIVFYGSEGSSLEFSLSAREDDYSVRELKEILYQANHTVDGIEQNTIINGENCFILNGEIHDRYLQYNLVRVTNGYIMQMLITYPECKNQKDQDQKNYFTDCMYRMCDFSGSSHGGYRSFSQFKNNEG